MKKKDINLEIGSVNKLEEKYKELKKMEENKNNIETKLSNIFNWSG